MPGEREVTCLKPLTKFRSEKLEARGRPRKKFAVKEDEDDEDSDD